MAEEVLAGAPDDASFAARMTQIQFRALGARLRTGRVQADVDSLPHFSRLRRGAQCQEQIVRQWLVNGWSTENLIRINRKNLEGDALAHSLHWTFPQAYYSVYALTMAYFQSVGFSEESHTAVIRKFGVESVSGRYPKTVAFALVGGKQRLYHHITPLALPNTLQFDPTAPAECDGRICQFLNATRQQDLSAKKTDMKLRNAKGRVKRKLTPEDWEKVSDQLGPTSVLSLLYRKRIKANYRDIDSYLSPSLDAPRLFHDVLQTVLTCNFVHELYVVRALGVSAFQACLPPRIEKRFPFLEARLAACTSRAA